MKTVSSFAVATLFTTSLAGQPLFDKAYSLPGDTMSSAGISMRTREAANGGLIVASFHTEENGSGSGPNVILLHRTDPDGSLLWRRRIRHASWNFTCMFDMRELQDGTILLVGRGGTGAGMCIHADADGWPLSARSIEPGTSISDLLTAIQVADGSLLLAGSAAIAGFRVPVVAFGSVDGIIDTAFVMDYDVTNGNFSSIATCADGGYMMSGTGINIVDPDTTLYSVLLAKFDSAWTLQWAGKLEESTSSGLFYPHGVFELPDGGFRVFAESRKQGSLHSDALMLAVSATGQIQWQERIEFTTYSGGLPLETVMQADGAHYWITGGYQTMGRGAVVIDSSGTISDANASGAGTGVWTYHAIRASNGSLVSITLALDPNGSGEYVPKLTRDNVVPNTCSPTPLSHVISAGDLTFHETGTPLGVLTSTTDILPDLLVVAELPDVFDQCISTSTSGIQYEAEPFLRPVPATNDLWITAPGTEALTVIDAMGRTVLRVRYPVSGIIRIDVSALVPGTYAVIAEGPGMRNSGRFIKE